MCFLFVLGIRDSVFQTVSAFTEVRSRARSDLLWIRSRKCTYSHPHPLSGRPSCGFGDGTSWWRLPGATQGWKSVFRVKGTDIKPDTSSVSWKRESQGSFLCVWKPCCFLPRYQTRSLSKQKLLKGPWSRPDRFPHKWCWFIYNISAKPDLFFFFLWGGVWKLGYLLNAGVMEGKNKIPFRPLELGVLCLWPKKETYLTSVNPGLILRILHILTLKLSVIQSVRISKQ